MYAGVGHGCRYGVKHVRSGKLLLQPTLWFSTSPEICDELARRCKNEECPGHHEHDTCLGGSDITGHAGRYTKEIAVAVNRGFVKLMRRKEPSRIHVLLRSISAKIRRRDPEVSGLRWNERNLKTCFG